jgi:hypothetical protein
MNECRLSTLFALLAYTLTNGYAGHLVCQEPITLNTLNSNQLVHYLPVIVPTRFRELEKGRKEEDGMVAAMLQKEKEAAKWFQQEEELKVAAALASSATKEVQTLPPVVSPPLAPNLTSLLTGHIGQESETVSENGNTLTAADTVADEISKSPKEKKSKKSKSNKEDNASKHDSSSSVLKKSSFTESTSAVAPSTKEYKYQQVFYEVGIELKGEDKHGVYFKQIENLIKNIQLVNPTAIMHAAVEPENSKPLDSKAEMNTYMTIFLAYTPVGNNANAFKQKILKTRQRDAKARMSWIPLTPAYTPC